MSALGDGISRDPIGAEGGVSVYGFVGNDPLISWDDFGLYVSPGYPGPLPPMTTQFEFVVIKNDGSTHRENSTGDWGSPDGYFSATITRSPSSVTTTLTASGPISGHCCNTVVSADPREVDNGNAGSIRVYMSGAGKGTYSVSLTFSGSASITVPAGGAQAAVAGASLSFHHPDAGLSSPSSPNYPRKTIVMNGVVSYGGPAAGGNVLTWVPEPPSKTSTAVVVVSYSNERVLVAEYDVTMQLNKCGAISVTATGSIAVGGHTKLK